MELKKTDTFIEHDIIVDNTNVGTVELCPERHEISRLVIFEPYQNKGYGTQVVQSLVKQGYTSLWVRSDNPRAIHVYEKCGFIKGETTMLEMVYNPIDETSTVELIANSNYIKYEDAIEAIKTLQIKDDNRHLNDYEYGQNVALDLVIEELETLPSADLMEVKRGEWIIEYHGNGWNDYWDYTCSVCGKKFEKADNVLYRAKFCPNCGSINARETDEQIHNTRR